MLRRHRDVEPPEWGRRFGRARVLVENPDAAQAQGYADVLRAEGYDVATCEGPKKGERCPLLEHGNCGLVEGADVVFSTCSMPESSELLEQLGWTRWTGLVIEAPAPEAERVAGLVGRGVLIATPVTTGRLLDAIDEALPEAG